MSLIQYNPIIIIPIRISYSDSISCQYEFVGKSWGFSIFGAPICERLSWRLKHGQRNFSIRWRLRKCKIIDKPHGFPIIMENIYRWFPYIYFYIYIYTHNISRCYLLFPYIYIYIWNYMSHEPLFIILYRWFPQTSSVTFPFPPCPSDIFQPCAEKISTFLLANSCEILSLWVII